MSQIEKKLLEEVSRFRAINKYANNLLNEQDAPPTDLPPADAGVPPMDMGTPPADASVPPMDMGTPPADASVPPMDMGTTPAESDTEEIDITDLVNMNK